MESGRFEFFEEDADGEVELVGEDRVFGEWRNRVWQEVEREHIATEEVLEGVEEEDDGGDLEEPEGEHGEGVRHEELD